MYDISFDADEVRNVEQEYNTKVVGVRFQDAAGRKFETPFRTQPKVHISEGRPTGE